MRLCAWWLLLVQFLHKLEMHRHAPEESSLLETAESKPLQYGGAQSAPLYQLPPDSNMKEINATYSQLFTFPRNHERPKEKTHFRQLLRTRLAQYGYEMLEQQFRVRQLKLNQDDRRANRVLNQVGQNLIAVLPGRYSVSSLRPGGRRSHARRTRQAKNNGTDSWRISSKLLELLNFVRENKIDKRFFANDTNRTSEFEDMMASEMDINSSPQEPERLIVIGAHYDTMPNCPGVNDNGSGSMVVLELARLFSALKKQFKYTIMFVWFDFEESGGLGSLAFVNHYLIPTLLKDGRRKFEGAYIMDMVLTYDTTNNTQFVPVDIMKNFPLKVSEMASNGFKSDFLALWLRAVHDQDLLRRILNAQEMIEKEDDKSTKLIPMAIKMPAFAYNQTHLYKYRTFLRSDHSSFWFASKTYGQFNLPALLFTDLGPWREAHRKCYHKACDDASQLTPQNLNQLMQTIRLLKEVLLGYEMQ